MQVLQFSSHKLLEEAQILSFRKAIMREGKNKGSRVSTSCCPVSTDQNLTDLRVKNQNEGFVRFALVAQLIADYSSLNREALNL